MKFGGTSVQDATAINQAATIVLGRIARAPIVVVSAMARVTDTLVRMARAAQERRIDETSSNIEALRERHIATARELLAGSPRPSAGAHLLGPVEREIENQFAELESLIRSVSTLGELTPRTQDAIVSFGERMSSVIVAAAFQRKGIQAYVVDSRQFIITDDNFTTALPDIQETTRRARATLLPSIESGRVPVAQGFIGATAEGVTTTIGRGGSDYTAALIGAGLEVEAIEIWTDVDGLMTTDPRVVPDAKRIRVISFSEASELSYFGARVLHPSTVKYTPKR